jgi:hypothetical protein
MLRLENQDAYRPQTMIRYPTNDGAFGQLYAGASWCGVSVLGA